MIDWEPLADHLPLQGIRILEFSHAVLGPTCGVTLADFGAEVIKIEPAPDGDPTRRLSGFGMGYFPYLNRNKKSLVVNLKTEAGRAIISDLLQTADGLIENFGPGTMERLGLGYEALHQRYPRLIYCALKGFLPGPYQQRMALDEVVQMMSGLAYMTGRPGDPLRAGASIIDMMTGVYGAMGFLLALQERGKDGHGRFVTSALFETAAFVMGHHMTYAAVSGLPVPPMPARVSAWGIYDQFETEDGQRLFLGVTSDQQWQRFCQVFAQEGWLADERLATNNGRVALRDEFMPQLQSLFATMTLAEALARCEEAQLSFAPVARPEDLFDDPQLNQGGSLLETVLPDGRTTKLPRQPVLVGDQTWPIRRQPPQVGQHTAELLQELGYDEQTMADLAECHVIVLGGG